MLGIIAAMRVEAMELIEKMTAKTEVIISGITFTSGKLHGKDAVVAVCGIGKVFASMCAQTMILTYHPDAIVNTGVGGTLTDKLSICDMALSVNLVQHDMDTSALGDPVGLISGINVVYLPADKHLIETILSPEVAGNTHIVPGTIASGDQFIGGGARKQWIVEQFGAIACEMEGAAVAQVCYVNKVPFAVLRAISDNADGTSCDDYPAFVEKAAHVSASIVERLIVRL